MYIPQMLEGKGDYEKKRKEKALRIKRVMRKGSDVSGLREAEVVVGRLGNTRCMKRQF